MTKSKKDKVLDVVRSLAKHKKRKGLSVGDICEVNGMFPTDVESILKELHESGSVKCYIYRKKLYAVFQDRSTKEAMKKRNMKTVENSMFR